MKKKKVVPKFRQEVKVKVDIVTSDDIKIYYTGKFQDFTARYIINPIIRISLYLSTAKALNLDHYSILYLAKSVSSVHIRVRWDVSMLCFLNALRFLNALDDL